MTNKKIGTIFSVVIIVIVASIGSIFIIRAGTSAGKAIDEKTKSEVQLQEINQRAVRYAHQLIQEAHAIDEGKIKILMERGYDRDESVLLLQDDKKMTEEQIKILMEVGYSRSKAEELLADDSK